MSVGRRSWAGVALSAVAFGACSSSPATPLRAVPPSVSSTVTTLEAAAPETAPTTAAEPSSAIPSATTPGGPAPDSSGFAATTSPVSAEELGASWHDGCPLGPDRLRLVTLSYWGFDDRSHEGSLVLNADVTDAVIEVFHRLYDERFPIRRMEPVDVFGGDDDASMAADNTSAFNCRSVEAPGPPRWSAHAYGQAIDVNPVENPYVQGDDVQPPAGADYVDRSPARPGMAVAGGPLTEAFAAAGWSWGGTWRSPDYQHFSTTGG